ncbi:MAG: pyruvate dehydrogenase (acetyl-transferring) E1 component subunit alpha, partial [Verrucomicrobiaceae bacterium]
KGMGGSMHIFSKEHGFYGGHGIVGAQIPVGAGIAFADKYFNTGGVTMTYFGDGAARQGSLHEAFNMAMLWKLPVVFIVENNGFSMGTSVKRSSAFKDHLGRRAEMYDMDWDRCAGHDIYAIRACLDSAMRRAREHQRPTLLEISTYRYFGFTVADANTKKYRTPDDIAWHREHRDPVDLWMQRLIQEGIAKEALHEQVRSAAKKEAGEAVRWACAQPAPEISDISRDVYWETDHGTPASRIGRHFFDDA